MAKRVVLPVLLSVPLILGGCPTTNGPSNQPADSKLVPFNSKEALLSYFQEQAVEQTRVRNRGGWFLWGTSLDAAPGAVTGEYASAEGDAAGGGSAGYSTTNLQEEGVDESDVFKQDGNYFYVAKDQTLRIVQAKPAENLAEVGRLELNAYAESLYLSGKTVIALGTQVDGTPAGAGGWGGTEIMIWPPYYRRAKTSVIQIDVTDPANPTITHRLELDGSLVSSRLTNGRLIVVLTVVPDLPSGATPAGIRQMTLAQIMPKVQVSGGEAADAIPWNNWLHPEAPDGCATSAVITLDAANVETIVESVAVLANAGTIYVSPAALYLTDSEYDPSDNYRENTVIHKFTFGEDGAARYAASGTVPGRLLNQFSLGEYEGNLRVATHRVGDGGGVLWRDVVVTMAGSGDAATSVDAAPPDSAQAQTNPQEPDNAVFVLGQSADSLDILGSVANFGTNEQIYAVRFIADHGFVVTYRQMDPLFVIDLGDPANPHLVGELQAPGFSDYLHPLGSDYLIGVGHATDQTEWGGTGVKGIQLSLFDVSDWTNPQVVQQLSLGSWGSESDVSYTHKAFALIERDGQTLIAIPAILTTDSGGYYYDWGFAGVLCYSVDPAAGFTELGRLASVGQQVGWWPQWQRGAFIGDEIYALTPDGIRAAALTDFGTTEQTSFAE
jgi:inhibitor of cysteine peptidase